MNLDKADLVSETKAQAKVVSDFEEFYKLLVMF